MKRPGQIILAIESAIAGGSLSLVSDGREVAGWTGSASVSKAESLLVHIDALFTVSGISRRQLDLIAVSAGPGSFTGIRIGIATALGLKAGLGIGMASESALKAMAFAGPPGRNIIAAVPVGRNAVCRQSFEIGDHEVMAIDEPRNITEAEFLAEVGMENNARYLLHAALYERSAPATGVINFGANVAHAIGMICSENAGVVTEPLFISKGL